MISQDKICLAGKHLNCQYYLLVRESARSMCPPMFHYYRSQLQGDRYEMAIDVRTIYKSLTRYSYPDLIDHSGGIVIFLRHLEFPYTIIGTHTEYR